MANDDLDRVVPLDQLDDFRVAEGDPDVRGWEVVASDGRKIGEVDQLLVDTAAMKVRYLDVDLEDELIAETREASERHVLIPIGYARLDEGSDRVIVDNLASSDLAGLPEYTHGPITRDFESDLRTRFDRGHVPGAAETGAGRDRDFYAHDLYDENRFYGARRPDRDRDEAHMTRAEEELDIEKRRMEAGEVDLHKRVEKEHVSRPVTKSHEEAIVERRPITREGMRADTNLENEDIRIPLMEEEVVVEKHVVPKEELVVKKRRVEETENVEADLRRERVDIERKGDARVRDERRDDRI